MHMYAGAIAPSQRARVSSGAAGGPRGELCSCGSVGDPPGCGRDTALSYVRVCVCAWTRACVGAWMHECAFVCMSACVCVNARIHGRMRVRACAREPGIACDVPFSSCCLFLHLWPNGHCRFEFSGSGRNSGRKGLIGNLPSYAGGVSVDMSPRFPSPGVRRNSPDARFDAPCRPRSGTDRGEHGALTRAAGEFRRTPGEGHRWDVSTEIAPA